MAHHLTMQERDRIAQLRYQGADQKEIAKALGRSPSTISRELRRNGTADEYYAAVAQVKAEQRRRERPLTRKMDEVQINEMVRRGLSMNWSPDQIAQRAKREHPHDHRRHISAQTIYSWIEQDADRRHWKSLMRRRGRRPRCRKSSQNCGRNARIGNRPDEIEQRQRLGDFEGDTVLGRLGTGGLVTLVDRKARFTMIIKIRSKNAAHVHEKIKQRLKELEAERRHSVTFDNGSEFANCQRMEKHLQIKLYLADPGRPHQRGTNENTNGLIRQYFPKGTDFRDVTHYEVREVENLINNRPRKCLDYQTPAEVFFEKTAIPDCD